MSLFIKGMEMPKPDENGLETTMGLVLSSSGLVELIDPDTNTLLEEYRAIEVPTPHGRLIDADKMNETNIGLLNTLRRCQVAVCWLKHCEIFSMPDNDGFCSECAWNFLKEHDMTLKEAGHD